MALIPVDIFRDDLKEKVVYLSLLHIGLTVTRRNLLAAQSSAPNLYTCIT